MSSDVDPGVPAPGPAGVAAGGRASGPDVPWAGKRVVQVAAHGRNRVIGVAGGLPWHLPEDFAHFKRLTLGHTLVMGRRTYDSIGRPLPGRTTIVVTRDESWAPAPEHADDVVVAHSVPDALTLAAGLPGDIMVAGGAQVYEAAMPYATEQVLSEVDAEPEGDTFYPPLDDTWVEVGRERHEGFDVVRWERS